MGYFMTLDLAKFGMSTFKILVKTPKSKEFEHHVASIENIKNMAVMFGSLNYEIDLICVDIGEFQEEAIGSERRNKPDDTKLLNHGFDLIY